ncbi:MAG: histidinol dehydrogenase, partial [Halanaerobiales bacterium]
ARVGVYIPGGRAPYPSSVLMTVLPAVVAGVDEIVGTTPPGEDGKVNPHILVAAAEAGVDELYKAGGAQAIAAMAWGTETINPVDKIVGPGNIYVTLAKKIVYGQVDIDMLAGPSEIMILCDGKADPTYIAADMLSQAEHDPMAASILVCSSGELITKVEREMESQLQELPREEIARQSLAEQGLIIEVETLENGLELVNRFAPEHFELMVKEPMSYLGQVKNAGAVFLGEYSPEPLGDYLAGPNHVLPTGGTARYASPLNTDDFIKKSSLIYYGKQGLKDEVEDIGRFARLEEFDAHARAAEIRFKEE